MDEINNCSLQIFYPAVLTYEDDGITVEFPDLPGCITCGDTKDEAVEMAYEALHLHLCGMSADKEDLPYPTKTADIKLEDNQDVVLIKASL